MTSWRALFIFIYFQITFFFIEFVYFRNQILNERFLQKSYRLKWEECHYTGCVIYFENTIVSLGWEKVQQKDMSHEHLEKNSLEAYVAYPSSPINPFKNVSKVYVLLCSQNVLFFLKIKKRSGTNLHKYSAFIIWHSLKVLPAVPFLFE